MLLLVYTRVPGCKSFQILSIVNLFSFGLHFSEEHLFMYLLGILNFLFLIDLLGSFLNIMDTIHVQIINIFSHCDLPFHFFKVSFTYFNGKLGLNKLKSHCQTGMSSKVVS